LTKDLILGLKIRIPQDEAWGFEIQRMRIVEATPHVDTVGSKPYWLALTLKECEL